MDIPNLSTQPQPVIKKSPLIIIGIVAVALISGFILSRMLPSSPSDTTSQQSSPSNTESNIVDAESIQSKEDIKVGLTYGNSTVNYKDSAVGTIESGSINGEGTHILNREGGATQRAALTSSSLDLDLFVGHKVEVKGETNTSKKVGWLLDVGSVKVIE